MGRPGSASTLRRRAASAALAAATVVALAGCGGAADDGLPTINLYYAPEENLGAVVAACTAQAGGRYRIVHRVLPRGADDQRVQMVRRLAAADTSMDILGLDVTWTAEFAGARWIRPWDDASAAEARRGTLAGPLESATYRGALYAAPKNTNVQLLWYRADLVTSPPRTWDEMIDTALRLKAQGRTHRVITMGAQYEGLVVLFNTLVASAGGQLVPDPGARVVVDASVERAADALRRLATAGVTSPSFSNAMEDAARLEFQSGGGAFQLNWPFVYPAMREGAPELAAKVRWARFPALDHSRPSRVTIGGYNLAVSRYSRRPAQAFEAALCLRSAAHQKHSAINDGVPPTIESVYADPQMAEAYPMRDTILAELRDAANRPLTPAYQNVSTVLAAALSPPSRIGPDTVEELRDAVQAALDSKGVLP
ncbi:ABC transporter substrate-binding protein [Pilimelia columellifera]